MPIVKFDGEHKKISMKNSQGESSCKFTCEENSIYAGYNCMFMLDAFKQLNSSKVMVEFTGKMTPVIITDDTYYTENKGSLQLLMPVRLPE